MANQDTAQYEVVSPDAPVKAPGLKGVIALDSELTFIDGQNGKLVYRGYEISDLAARATYEEVVYLLWNGVLPTQDELDEFTAGFRASRELPEPILDLLRSVPAEAHPMAVLRTAVSALGLHDPEADVMEPSANTRKATRALAQIPAIIAAFARLRDGKEPIEPLSDESMAYNFLYMLNGEAPGAAAERIFDTCLVLHADHGLNASTFAGRVIGSTLSDLYSALAGSIGALKGPLHGGANREVMRMLLDIDSSEKDAVSYVEERLEKGDRVMGFGHRVYKTMDPRAAILRDMVKDLSEETGDLKWYDYSMAILNTVQDAKGLDPNVDFFSASTYYQLGLDPDLFTPIFALSRTAGWSANLLEQWSDNQLIRPRAQYVGPTDRTFVPIEERS
jgi:citrate synthase